jgi:actin-related protein
MNIEIKPDYAMDSAVDQSERRVVIDNGSDTLKIGFSGDDWPSVIQIFFLID